MVGLVRAVASRMADPGVCVYSEGALAVTTQPGTSTPLKLDVTVGGAGALGPLASEALKSSLQSYAEEVFAEASRYEVLQRASVSQPPEFTSKHILDADIAVRRRFTLPAPKPPVRKRIIGSVALYGFAAGVGVGGNRLDDTWGLVVFVGCLVAGLFTAALLETGRGGAS